MTVVDQTYTIKKDEDSRVKRIEEDIGTNVEYFEEMPRSKAGLRVTEEEYWEIYYHDLDFTYEWNNGILEEKPMADYLSFEMYRWFLKLLEEFLRAFPIAKIIGLEIGFRLAFRKETSIRRPDLGVILHANAVDIAPDDCTYKGIVDLCIEFLSDSKLEDVKRDTVVKKKEYRQVGVKEYFILDRKGKHTAFYRLNEKGQYLQIPQQPGGVIRSEVLPGFQFRLADLYAHPEFMDLIDNRVYQPYILWDYQAERQRAETERQRAETERQRAETEHQEKLKLAAKLRELGIDPDSL